jgi:DNA topoisomerase-3
VQTPTLAIVVEREEKIKKFVPRNYWEIHGTFAAEAGQYTGRWFDEKFARPERKATTELKPERVWEQSALPRRSKRNASANRASSPKRASRDVDVAAAL